MTKAIDIAAVEKGTGRSWPDWLAFLEGIGARDLSHKEIARRLQADCGVGDWWAQSITVAYEQQTGRRLPGQRSGGGFQLSVSRSFEASLDQLLARWQAAMEGREEFAGIAVVQGPEVSRTEKWRYWRCGLADGSRVSVSIGRKDDRKAVLGLGHEKLESTQAVEQWRLYWKGELAGL